MCYKWHCCNMCVAAKFRSVWYLSSPTSLTNVAKPRSITNVQEFRILFCHTLVQSIKKNEENVRNSTVADCFSSGIIWCAAFIVRNKFEQLIKEGSRFIFSILYFSGTIAISTFLSDKRKLSFPRYSQVDLLGEKYLWNCTTHNNGLELIKLTIISSTEQCVPPAHKFQFLWEWLFCLDTLCSFVFKALSLSSLVRLSRLLNGCGVLQPLLLFSSSIY